MKLSVIIPCCNEEKNIPLILDGFKKVIGNRSDIEIIIVDNNSTDGTAIVLSELAPNYSFLRSMKVMEIGYGIAVLSGLKEAKGEYIGWTHGDFQTPPVDVIKALEIIEKINNPQNIYIKGLRNGRPILDRFFTFGMGIFESLYFGKLFYDINAQPNIFHKSFLESWSDPPHDFSLDLYAFYLAKKKNMPIVRFPVLFKKRIYGESHWNKNLYSKWKFIKRTVSFSRSLKEKLLINS